MKNTAYRLAALSEMLSESDDQQVLAEASMRGTFASYLAQAERAFLNAAAKQIRKIAGGHAERVEVKQGRSAGFVWLIYQGQDRSDIDLEFTVSIGMASPHEVVVHWDSRHVVNGNDYGELRDSIGQLSPDRIAALFQEKFGR